MLRLQRSESAPEQDTLVDVWLTISVQDSPIVKSSGVRQSKIIKSGSVRLNWLTQVLTDG